MFGRLILVAMAAAATLQSPRPPTGAAETPPPPPAACYQYQRALTAEAYNAFGLDAPVATLAGQMHQESACNPKARSRVGAAGLGQFMPATAADMAKRYPRQLAPADPFSPAWSIRALVTYNLELMRATRPLAGAELSECARWWFTLRHYNGGRGWTERDRRLAASKGANPDDPLAVEPFNAGRSPANHHENTTYPRRIILRHGPRYAAHAWGRAVLCDIPQA